MADIGPLLSVLDAFPLVVAAPAEKVVESVAVAQNVERIVRARLPPAFDRRVAHVRGTICRWLHPTPAGVLVTKPHIARVALAGVPEAEQVHPVPLQRHCSDEPQGACGSEACFLE